MSVNAIYFAFGLAAGFALFGVLLGTIWKGLWRERARWTARGRVTTLRSRRL
jgi:hypothetical protein